MENIQVPYIVHESGMARLERIIKRLWIVVIILIALFVATNGAWIWYESQWEYTETTVTQENDRGLNNYIGGNGGIYNGDEAFNADGHDANP